MSLIAWLKKGGTRLEKSFPSEAFAGVAADLVSPRTKSPRTISASGFGPLAATTRGFSPPMSDEVYAIVFCFFEVKLQCLCMYVRFLHEIHIRFACI